MPQPSTAKMVVMGVAGSGKTTLGRGLAAPLQADFLDADDFHTPQARARVVLACSALRRAYRDVLRVGPVHFIFLDLPEEVLWTRLLERQGHYAGTGLLASQLATLERPTGAETDVITLVVGASSTPATLLERALKALG